MPTNFVGNYLWLKWVTLLVEFLFLTHCFEKLHQLYEMGAGSHKALVKCLHWVQLTGMSLSWNLSEIWYATSESSVVISLHWENIYVFAIYVRLRIRFNDANSHSMARPLMQHQVESYNWTFTRMHKIWTSVNMPPSPQAGLIIKNRTRIVNFPIKRSFEHDRLTTLK